MAVTRNLEEEEEHRVERGERRREADPDNDVLVDELLMVKLRVAVESHPAAFVPVQVYVPELVYV